jgi:hypothetical protein
VISHSKKVVISLLVGIGLVTLPCTSYGDTIVDNPVDPLGAIFTSAAFGQSVTTPSGGPWNSISFGFYSFPGILGADGTLFLLSQSYSGSPSGLSSLTPGFLASTSSISNSGWQFAPSLTLQPNTQYFFYMNGVTGSPLLTSVRVGFAYPGGEGFRASNTASPYGTLPNDPAFNLQGVPVPEPGTIGLLILGLSTLVGVRNRRA